MLYIKIMMIRLTIFLLIGGLLTGNLIIANRINNDFIIAGQNALFGLTLILLLVFSQLLKEF